jgi:hypothetical protein
MREDSPHDYKMADSSPAQPQALGEDANTNKECKGDSCCDGKSSTSNLPKVTTGDFVAKQRLPHSVYQGKVPLATTVKDTTLFPLTVAQCDRMRVHINRLCDAITDFHVVYTLVIDVFC